MKSNESISREKLFSDTTEKKMEDLVFLGEKKIHKTTNNDVQVFHSYFCYLHSTSRKNYNTQTTTRRKFISDNNLNKTTKKFINCINKKARDFWVDDYLIYIVV